MSSFIKSLLFNIIETIVIFMIGLIFELSANYIITLMLTFFLCRMLCGQPKHYKSAYKCFVWSTLTFTSVYALTDLHFLVVILLTIFTGFISTGRANIEDMFMWKGNSLNNQVFDWVKFNQSNDKLLKYENDLKQNDKQKYFIFKYRFREFKSYTEIFDLMEMDIQRISDELKIISHFIEYSIRLDD